MCSSLRVTLNKKSSQEIVNSRRRGLVAPGNSRPASGQRKPLDWDNKPPAAASRDSFQAPPRPRPTLERASPSLLHLLHLASRPADSWRPTPTPNVKPNSNSSPPTPTADIWHLTLASQFRARCSLSSAPTELNSIRGPAKRPSEHLERRPDKCRKCQRPLTG